MASLRQALAALLVPAALSGTDARALETGLMIGNLRIEAEVAHTAPSREEGLMYRREMAPDHGMIFVFPESRPWCMWMANTLIPLSVAFLNESGTILNVEEMQAQTRTPHCAIRPSRFALEMNAGWFRRHHVEPGTSLQGLEGLPAPR